jgi:hypothetical protein
MVRDIADGYILVSERTFKGYSRKDLMDFVMEAETSAEIRSAQGPSRIRSRHRKDSGACSGSCRP